MTIDQEGRQFRLLTVHCVLSSLAMSLAGGFVGAWLLHCGFGLATTVLMNAVLLGVRFAMRGLVLPLVRRLGMRRAMLLGRAVGALQFLPLIGADQPGWVAAWVIIVSFGECLYWPICHAANAVQGGNGRRGWQLALRQIASTGISVLGPVAGGMALTYAGPSVEFGLATALSLMSAVPLFWMRPMNLGPVPSLRQSILGADRLGLVAFAADGWLSAGLGVAWPLILFAELGSSYDALGWAGSSAAVAGALAGLGCGIAIDRGHRCKLANFVTLALLAGVVLRVAAFWTPWAAFAANALGAAAGGLYYPVLMSLIYDRAKLSGAVYRFHLAAEAAWDAGAITGCVVAAAVAASGLPVTLAVLPSVVGIVIVQRCVRAEGRVSAQQLAVEAVAA